jgi:DNA processing protein
VRKRPSGYPPTVLWALGPARLDDIAERAAAVVGTRACTSYGEHVAAEITAGLVERDAAVVSGGAYGIDGAAHRAALASDGVTMAVLAGGIDVPYPSGHSALLHRVATSGLLLSEYPPGERPTRYRFLTRNRLAAALSGATVVVEAGLRSGAANTAAWATAMGRKVCAVPGPVTSAASAGCHVLIRNGAVLVDRAEQVVELIGRIGELADEPDHPVTPLDDLTPEQLQVYEALPARGFRSLEQISVGAALPPERVLGPLALLEISGLVEKQDGQWRIRRAG